MKFLDLVKIYIKSGSGGTGALSFRREKFIEKGGPDGGDGGRGGSVWAIPEKSLNTLIDFKYKKHHFAENGRPGQGQRKTGESGKDIYIKLPLGTEILDEEQNLLTGEIISLTDKVLLSSGGAGGLGNHHFKSPVNRAPRKFTKGEEGFERIIWLRLKLIADVGFLGLPNAGKSTLLSVISQAKPKIADYPFTTLTPKLGVVSIFNSQLVFADIPGLIVGAHEGKGAGIRFLGHIERCKALIHLLDCTSTKLEEDYHTVLNELRQYDKKLLKKPRITVLNKIDAIPKEKIEKKKQLLKKYENKIYLISALNKLGLDEVLMESSRQIKLKESDSDEFSKTEKQWHPIDQ